MPTIIYTIEEVFEEEDVHSFMIINILSIIYLLIVFCVFTILKPIFRKPWLFITSCIYIGIMNMRALVAVLITTIVFYLLALGIERYRDKQSKNSKILMILSAMAAALSLIAFKYAGVLGEKNWVNENIVSAFAVPIGFSFYLLGAVSYLRGVYSGTEKAQRNLLNFCLYMCWFPKFVSGPIEEQNSFDKQINNALSHRNSWDTIKTAALRITYGMFLKLVVADRLGIYVDDIYLNMTEYGSIALAVGAIFYSAQIYCDFAGYTYFARGVSHLFGIELTENFVTPYLAENITEFWRRWHISLSNWLKNNIYIPLGGNRKGNIRKAVNTIIVFVVSGFWHGATLSFLIWGALHGVYSIIADIFRKKKLTFFIKGISGRIINFGAVTFAWIFFRSQNVSEALNYIRCMFTNGIRLWYLGTHFRETWRQFIDPIVTISFMLLIFAFDLIARRKSKDITEVIKSKGNACSLAFIYCMIVAVIVFGVYGASIFEKTYIYMQF